MGVNKNNMKNSFKIIGITDITIRRILQEAGGDALGLYVAYFEVAKWQSTYKVKATTGFMAKRLGWTEKKIIKNKKLLISLNIIEDYQDKGADGRIKGHYIEINHLVDEDHTPQKQQDEKITERVLDPQVLSTGNKVLSTNIKVLISPGQISEERGKTSLIRIMWVYQHLWRKKFNTKFVIENWGRYGTMIKSLLKNYTEIQIASLICCMFNWYGADGKDQKEQDFVEKAFYPFGMISSQMNKYTTYLKNVEKIDFNNEQAIKNYVACCLNQ